MFDRFILFGCAVTVVVMVAGWADAVVASERVGVTTVEHVAR